MGTNGSNGNNSSHIIGSSLLSHSHFSALQGLICDCQLVGSSWLSGLSSVSLSRNHWMCLSKATAIGTYHGNTIVHAELQLPVPQCSVCTRVLNKFWNQQRQMLGGVLATPWKFELIRDARTYLRGRWNFDFWGSCYSFYSGHFIFLLVTEKYEFCIFKDIFKFELIRNRWCIIIF